MRALLLVLAIASCSKKVPKHDFVAATYPGFSLDVPKPLGSARADAAYERGDNRWKSETAVYSVSWNFGAVPPPETEKMFLAGIELEVAPTKILAAKRLRINNSDALRIDFKKGDDFWAIAAIGCGTRKVQVMVHARERGEETLQRMLSSFVCKPDPTKDMPIAGVVGLDDTARVAGWKREQNANGYVISDATGGHAATFVPGDGEAQDLELFRSMLPDWKFTNPSTTTVAGSPRHWIEMKSGGGLTGIAAAWACGSSARGVLAAAVGYTPADAREFLSAFRCPRAGDQPLVAN